MQTERTAERKSSIKEPSFTKEQGVITLKMVSLTCHKYFDIKMTLPNIADCS